MEGWGGHDPENRFPRQEGTETKQLHISALRAQVKHKSSCKRKCSLFINARCSVRLPVLAFEAKRRSLFRCHRGCNDRLHQADFFFF